MILTAAAIVFFALQSALISLEGIGLFDLKCFANLDITYNNME